MDSAQPHADQRDAHSQQQKKQAEIRQPGPAWRISASFSRASASISRTAGTTFSAFSEEKTGRPG